MVFTRKYRQGDRTYYADVESYRDEHGRPRLLRMGVSVEALVAWTDRVEGVAGVA